MAERCSAQSPMAYMSLMFVCRLRSTKMPRFVSMLEFDKNPILGEALVMNYRVAEIDDRTRKMLDFSVKMTEASYRIEEQDREHLRKVGFSDRDIWDISAVASFFNMTNRMASAVDMRPNDEYHKVHR